MKRSLAVLLILCGLGSSSIAFAGGATVTYIYTDGQGSPVAEADGAGNVTATFDYTPLGSTLLGTQQNGPGYTGHVADPDTSLTYMQARYYDPSVGQFLSVDPVMLTAGRVTALGAYTYAENNPTTRTDPDGRWTEQKDLVSMGYIIHFTDPPASEGSAAGSPTSSQGQSSPSPTQPGGSTSNGASQQTESSAAGQELQYKSNIPPATGRLLTLLQCIQAQCANEGMVVTSTDEASKAHPPGDVHRRGAAADLRVPTGNYNHVLQCASNCGAGDAVNEAAHPSTRATGPHIHVQLGPNFSGGRGDLPPPEEHQ